MKKNKKKLYRKRKETKEIYKVQKQNVQQNRSAYRIYRLELKLIQSLTENNRIRDKTDTEK